mmetsp:Transcript_30401/g.75531  ORF Transcript_30401/g.75531 Transcript_30401/m.75531 type:complete len:211 (-) Transcript_30401:3348-3980(-)
MVLSLTSAPFSATATTFSFTPSNLSVTSASLSVTWDFKPSALSPTAVFKPSALSAYCAATSLASSARPSAASTTSAAFSSAASCAAVTPLLSSESASPPTRSTCSLPSVSIPLRSCSAFCFDSGAPLMYACASFSAFAVAAEVAPMAERSLRPLILDGDLHQSPPPTLDTRISPFATRLVGSSQQFPLCKPGMYVGPPWTWSFFLVSASR